MDTEKHRVVFDDISKVQRDSLDRLIDSSMRCALDTGFADRHRAETAIIKLYALHGLTAPSIIWACGPVDATEKVRDIPHHLFALKLRDRLWTKVPEEFQHIKRRYFAGLDLSVEQSFRRATEKALLKHKDKDKDVVSTTNQWAHGGQQDVHWIALHQFLRTLGVEYPEQETKELDLWDEISRSCGWWWGFKDTVVLTERPQEVGLEANLSGKDLQPYIRYRDGLEVGSKAAPKEDSKAPQETKKPEETRKPITISLPPVTVAGDQVQYMMIGGLPGGWTATVIDPADTKEKPMSTFSTGVATAIGSTPPTGLAGNVFSKKDVDPLAKDATPWVRNDIRNADFVRDLNLTVKRYLYLRSIFSADFRPDDEIKHLVKLAYDYHRIDLNAYFEIRVLAQNEKHKDGTDIGHLLLDVYDEEVDQDTIKFLRERELERMKSGHQYHIFRNNVSDESKSEAATKFEAIQEKPVIVDGGAPPVSEKMPTNEKTPIASKTRKVAKTAKTELKSSATIVGARQLAKSVRDPLVEFLTQTLGADKKKANKFLSSPEGLALVKLALGSGISFLPWAEYEMGTDGEYVPANKLAAVASVMRQDGFADLGDNAADLLTGPIFKKFGGVMATITAMASEKVRVDVAGTAAANDDDESEAVAAKTAARRA